MATCGGQGGPVSCGVANCKEHIVIPVCRNCGVRAVGSYNLQCRTSGIYHDWAGMDTEIWAQYTKDFDALYRPSAVVPGGANRAPKDGTPAHWYSVDRESVLAIAETAAEGDTRYGVDNWRKGLPVSNLINHAMDHLFKALDGDSSEPHIDHAIWNLGKIKWMAKHKPEMVDVPMIRKSLGMPDADQSK